MAGFEVFVERDFFVFLFELDFVAFAQGVLGELVLAVAQLQLGGNANVFNLMLTLFSIGIAAGSVLCSKASKGSLHLHV